MVIIIHKSAQFKRDFVRLTDSKRVLMKTSKAYEKISDCLHVSISSSPLADPQLMIETLTMNRN